MFLDARCMVGPVFNGEEVEGMICPRFPSLLEACFQTVYLNGMRRCSADLPSCLTEIDLESLCGNGIEERAE